MKKKFGMIIFPILVFVLGFTVSARISENGGQGASGENDDIINVLKKIIDGLKKVAYPFTVFFVILGGYQMIQSGGDPKRFDQGRNTLLFGLAGFLVVLIADLLVDLIKKIVG